MLVLEAMRSWIERAFSPPPLKVTNLEFLDDFHGVWELLETGRFGEVSKEKILTEIFITITLNIT